MNVEADIADGLLEAAADLAAQLTLPIAMPDVQFDPGNAPKYLEAVHFRNTTGSPTWGQDKVHLGILQINLVFTVSEGSIGPLQLAGTIADAFHKNRTIFKGAARVKIYQNPTILTAIVEGEKTIYPVSIPYLVTAMETS